MLYREIISCFFSDPHKTPNTLCGQKVELLNVKPGGTYYDHWALESYISVIKTSQLMLCRGIIAVCSQIHTNTQCGQNIELLKVKPGGTYCD